MCLCHIRAHAGCLTRSLLASLCPCAAFMSSSSSTQPPVTVAMSTVAPVRSSRASCGHRSLAFKEATVGQFRCSGCQRQQLADLALVGQTDHKIGTAFARCPDCGTGTPIFGALSRPSKRTDLLYCSDCSAIVALCVPMDRPVEVACTCARCMSKPRDSPEMKKWSPTHCLKLQQSPVRHAASSVGRLATGDKSASVVRRLDFASSAPAL